ncbi:MAG: cysteine desulfurase family protein [Candidatus Colwellbacteria bacterium]|nr:cysteine desulfurase family protein [Candidatus Colwellbacteria bacterium]
MEKVYLDYSASTPVAPEVREAMEPYFSEHFGNPGSIHSWGQKAQAALDHSREIIADELNVKFSEVVFTGSATEANNLVVRGVAAGSKGIDKPRIIVSAIEHPSVLETARTLTADGVEVVCLGVNREGFIDPQALKNSLNERTVLVSIIYASNEIGTIQPIKEVARIISEFRESKKKLSLGQRSGLREENFLLQYPLFHTDIVQAFQFFKMDLQELGVDAFSISGHKIYGPKGVGILVLRNEWEPYLGRIITGGHQELGLRAGTENVPAIVGLGKAVELVSHDREEEAKRIGSLRDYFWEKLKRAVPEIELNGSLGNRLPNNLNICFPNKEGGDLLIKLDQAGVAVSAGSACSAKAPKPSHVITALGMGEKRAKQSLRFTLGRPTTKEEIDMALERIIKLVS